MDKKIPPESCAAGRAREALEMGAWAFLPDRLLIGHVTSIDMDGRVLVQLHNRLGVAQDELLLSHKGMERWKRVRKPVFPVADVCTNLADVMLPDYDYRMCDAQWARVLAVPRLLDAKAYSQFHAGMGYRDGVSVAMSDLADEMRERFGGDVLRNPFALPLEDYLLLTVRPRNSALAFLCDDYPLDLAVEDWVHAQADVQASVCPEQVTQRDVVRDRSYVCG